MLNNNSWVQSCKSARANSLAAAAFILRSSSVARSLSSSMALSARPLLGRRGTKLALSGCPAPSAKATPPGTAGVGANAFANMASTILKPSTTRLVTPSVEAWVGVCVRVCVRCVHAEFGARGAGYSRLRLRRRRLRLRQLLAGRRGTSSGNGNSMATA